MGNSLEVELCPLSILIPAPIQGGLALSPSDKKVILIQSLARRHYRHHATKSTNQMRHQYKYMKKSLEYKYTEYSKFQSDKDES